MKVVLLLIILTVQVAFGAEIIPPAKAKQVETERAVLASYIEELSEIREGNAKTWLSYSKKMIIAGTQLDELPAAHDLFDRDASYNFAVLVCITAVNEEFPLTKGIVNDLIARTAIVSTKNLTEAEDHAASRIMTLVIQENNALKKKLGITESEEK